MNNQIESFLLKYTEMDIRGVKIHCPYWMNKMKLGLVVVRGFQNGKGDADSIKKEILKKMEEGQITDSQITQEKLSKLAKRYRVGIDCSGFAYRLLDFLITQGFMKINVLKLDELFIEGINKTNVRKFISKEFSDPIQNISKMQVGDLISTKKGTHVLVVVDVNNGEVTYAHSSNRHTKTRGVHISKIELKDRTKLLKDQNWHELGSNGEKYNETFFYPEFRDGIYRIRPKFS